MNKFIKSAVAVAVTSLFAGGAFAVVDIEATPQGQQVFATELIAAGTIFANTGVAVLPGAPLTGALDVTTTLGFGVTTGQTRFIRLDLAGATFNGAPNILVARGPGETGPVGTNASIVSNTTSTYIFQITAQADYAQADVLDITMPAITATGSAAPVLTYSLFEDAPSAANNLVSGLLKKKDVEVYSSAPALVWGVTTGEATASVAELYKEFLAAGDDVALTAKLGAVNYTVNGTSLVPATGAPAALTDLVTAATNIVVTGDFGAAGTVELDNLAPFDCVAGATAATSVVGNVATFNVGTTDQTTAALCYTVTGNTAITKQTVNDGNAITAALDLTAAVGSTAADKAAATIAEIKHDGTTMKVPFLNAKTGQKSYVQLVNNGLIAAPFSVSCVTYSATLDGSITNLSVPANKSRAFTVAGLGCPSNTTAAILTFAVPDNGNVIGSLIRENATSGDAAVDGLIGNK